MDRVTLKPVGGKRPRLVRDPLTRIPMSPQGEEKPLNRYWRRLLKAGDVEIVKKAGRAAKGRAAGAQEG